MNDLTTHQMVSGIGADHTDKYGQIRKRVFNDWLGCHNSFG